MAEPASIQVPDDLAQVAEEKGIPLDVVRRALALGFPADGVKQQLQAPGVTAEQAEAFISEQEKIRAGGTINIPEELAAAAKKAEWPEELVKRALGLGAPVQMLITQMEAGIRADQAEAFMVQQELLKPHGEFFGILAPQVQSPIESRRQGFYFGAWQENLSL